MELRIYTAVRMADRPRTVQELYMLERLREKKQQPNGEVERKTREELLILLQIEMQKNERLTRELENWKPTPMDIA